ncbi:MAG: primosomal protein N' [Candidatus Latescibacteria bacterium]|nr:primosomal protein N' [Candidatus Latescibacterota bacterium]
MSRCYVEVFLPPPVSRELTYGVPAELAGEIQVGSAVLVPVRRRQLTGFVVGFADPPPKVTEILDLVRLVDRDSLLAPEVVELCRWLADYYFAPLGSALAAALPPGIKLTSNRLVSLREGLAPQPEAEPGELLLLAQLQESGPLKVSTLQRRLRRPDLEKILRRLEKAGRIEIHSVLPQAQVGALHRQWVRPLAGAEAQLPALQRRAPRQGQCLALVLQEGPLSKKSLRDRGFDDGLLRNLDTRGLVETFDQEVWRDPLGNLGEQAPELLEPTPDQRQVLEAVNQALDQRRFHAALLQGVTGSGKTLVYILAAARALEQGRGVIVLVPEIALAWQMVRRFAAHFGPQVAVMHSQLSPGERYDTWRRLRRGHQRLVIGARSAILAPVCDLGLIVVDEEHDGAYKQEDLEGRQPLCYHARDVALVRGRRQEAVVLLGSATPSLESYWNIRAGKYHVLSLPSRIDNRPLPQVEVVDMRQEPFQKKQRALFSRTLRLKIKDRLARREQIILLQNRRGFSPFVLCSACGEAVQCPQCRVSLTYHQSGETQLRCHYCDFRMPLPGFCPACGSAELRLEGVGTQKVEQALEEQFPGIRVIRMDVDTTGWKGAHDELVQRFRKGEAEVLLGTQMVAKGLDFPQVTLVGVISADTGMHLPDFRAAERTFQLLTQVAGRAGRGDLPGEVVIQTLLPEDRALKAAARQDFAAFVGPELEERREASFPPFVRLVAFLWQGAEDEEVAQAAREGAQYLCQASGTPAALLGPAPAPLARLRGRYRWQALLRGASAAQLHGWTVQALPAMREAARRHQAALTVNVDPLTLM